MCIRDSQWIGFIAALSFVIARLDQRKPFLCLLYTSYEDLMAAAGYIDEPTAETESGTAPTGIKEMEDLSQEEIDQVNQYISFLKSQRKG